MRFLSVCSGIEAASVAWSPLGWKAVAFSEIEPFPCALLAHHYPDTPNWGDMTKFKEWPDVSIDLLCGGTPCQSFSVAGLRSGLADPRGNLALTYLAIAAKYRPKWVVWENVPGVFSSVSHPAPDACPPAIDLDGVDGPGDGEEVVVEDEYDTDETHAFGCFLAGLSELGYGWAYRVLDAQFFGVPQRRRRVFVVGCLGDRASAAAVLFERHSMSGHPAPRREARQGPAGGVEFGPSGGGFTDLNPTLDARAKDGPMRNQLAGAVQHGPGIPDIVGQAMSAKWAKGTAGPAGPAGNEHHNLLPVPAYAPEVAATMVARSSRGGGQTNSPGHQADQELVVTHSLRGEGFDASEDGTGRGTPLVPVECQPIPIDMRQASRGATMTNNRPEGTSGGAPGTGIGEAGDPAPTISTSHTPAVGVIAFTAKDHGADAQEELSPTLRAGAHANSHANSGVMPAIAFNMHKSGNESSSLGISTDRTDCLRAFEKSPFAVQPAGAMQVRRLTPEECEKLQGFNPGYTAVPNRGKPAADGPRYKALGNSWAVPCARWIGQRIELVEKLTA